MRPPPGSREPRSRKARRSGALGHSAQPIYRCRTDGNLLPMSTISATPRSSGSSIEVRPIPGFPRYFASRTGRVQGKYGRWLKPQYRHDGHAMLHPRVDGQEKWLSVSHAVLLAWVGPRPDGMEACHRDGDSRNNRLDNLYWDTPARNPSRHLSRPAIRGSRHPNVKLTEEDVRTIRLLLADGRMSMDAIAQQFGVGITSIYRIRHGLTWGWLV